MSEDLRFQELSQLDPVVADAIKNELARQRTTLEMIASENFVPRAVLQAQGPFLPISTRKVTQAAATTVVANTQTSSKIWHVTAPRSSSALSSLTSSHTPVRRQTLPFCTLQLLLATRSWACPWLTVGTSLTA